MINTSKNSKTGNIHYGSDTIEHIFHTSKPPLATGLYGRFAVVQRPLSPTEKTDQGLSGDNAVVELLTVSNDGKLLHIHRDPHSASGWRQDIVPMPEVRSDRRSIEGSIERIAAFYQDNRIYAMIHYPAQEDSNIVVPMIFDEENGWREMELQGDLANALYRTRQTEVYRTPSGYHFFYGVSTAYEHPQFFVVFGTEDGQWHAVTERVPMPDATYRLLPGVNGDKTTGHTCLRIDSNGIHSMPFIFDSDEDGYFIDWGEQQASINLKLGPLSAANVHPFPSKVGTSSLLLHTEDKQLYYISGYVEGDLRIQPLTGGENQPSTLESISIGCDRFDRAISFAVSARNRRLWILRQFGFAENDDLTFDDWVCLGNRSTVIACPRAMLDGAELFLVNADDRSLEHMRQDENTTIWNNTTLAMASTKSGKGTQGTVHALEIEILNDQGGGVMDAALEIKSSYATDININGMSYQINATRWVPVNADASGRLTAYLPADSIIAPEIMLRVVATGEEETLYPDGVIAERLRGKDPRIKVNASTLRAAGLIPEQMKDGQAKAVADMLRRIGQDMNPKSTSEAPQEMTLDSNGKGVPAVKLKSLSHPAAPPSPADYVQHTVSEAPRRRRGFIAKLVGDIINAIKHAWQKIKKFIITVVKGAVELVITIGKTIHRLVVDTVKGIANAVVALFTTLGNMFVKVGKKVVEVVKKIVNFVRALFGWEDILVTNEVLKLTVNKTLDGFEQMLSGSVIHWADNKINSFRDKLDGMLTQMEQTFAPLSPDAILVSGDRSGRTSHMMQSLEKNKVASNMVGNQTMRNDQALRETITTEPPASDDPLVTFINKVNASYQQRIETELKGIFSDFHPTSLNEFFQGGIIATIRTLKPLVLFAVEVGGELLKLAIEGVARFIALIKEQLNKPIKIPLVSGFYEANSHGKKLTFLDLMTLLVAVPMTIVHKLVSGGKELKPPFSQKELQTFKKEDLNWGEMMAAVGKIMVEDTLTISNAVKKAAKWIVESVFMRRLSNLLGLFSGLTLWAHGHIMALKHAADSKEITGKLGAVFKIVAKISDIVRFAMTTPALLITVSGFIAKSSKDKVDSNEKSKWSFMKPLFTGILTVVGFGLIIFALVIPTPALVITMVEDLIKGVLLVLSSIWTIIVIVQHGIITGDGWTTSADGLGEFASIINSIPGLLSWVPPTVPLLDTAYGLGEILLIILMATDIVSAYASGACQTASYAIKLGQDK
jgi:hypothetical protein